MSASEKLKALERRETWREQPDPGDFGGHPYSEREREIGYGTPLDPRFPEMRQATYTILRALPQIVAVIEAAEALDRPHVADPFTNDLNHRLAMAVMSLDEVLS